jgi:hypothetical protein
MCGYRRLFGPYCAGEACETLGKATVFRADRDAGAATPVAPAAFLSTDGMTRPLLSVVTSWGR